MKLKKIFIITFIVILILTQASLILARAGGGESSRSSSSSYHSSSSGGGSYYHYGNYGDSNSGSLDSEDIFWIILITGAALILYIIIIKAFKSSAASSAEDQADEFLSGENIPKVRPAPALDYKIEQLRAKDPGFNEQVFLDKISTAFFKIQNAWLKYDMGPARALISDSVFERFKIQLEEYISKQWISQMEGLSLDQTVILDIRSDEHYDVIDVWITASAGDYVTDSGGVIVSGSPRRRTWDEKWSFLRSGKAQTSLNESDTDHQCPNCGAAIKSDAATGECEHCHSGLTTYEFGWVLSEITQLNC